MKVLVTGVGGAIGFSLVSQLLAQGDTVHCFNHEDYPLLRQIGANLIRGNLNDPVAVHNACEGVDIVYHLAGSLDNPVQRNQRDQTSIEGTRNLISACYTKAVSRIVYTSSAIVVSCDKGHLRGADESLPYATRGITAGQKDRINAEKLILSANGNQGLTTVALRPQYIWGPGDQCFLPFVFKQAAKQQLRIVDNAYSQIGVSYVENVAYAHLLAAKSDKVCGKAYFIQDEQPVILWDWLNYFFEGLGLPEVRETASYKSARGLLALSDTVQRMIGLRSEQEIISALLDTLVYDRYFSIAAAKRDFSYRPLVSMEDGIQMTLNYFRGSGWDHRERPVVNYRGKIGLGA